MPGRAAGTVVCSALRHGLPAPRILKMGLRPVCITFLRHHFF